MYVILVMLYCSLPFYDEWVFLRVVTVILLLVMSVYFARREIRQLRQSMDNVYHQVTSLRIIIVFIIY